MLGTVIAYFRKTKRARSSTQEPIIDDFTLRNTVSVKGATELTGTLEVETQVSEKEENPISRLQFGSEKRRVAG